MLSNSINYGRFPAPERLCRESWESQFSGEERVMSRQQTTVEQVRQIQDLFKEGMSFHNEKKFKEAIQSFKQGAAINPFEENHIEQLDKKLKTMSVKLVQESIAYMGCTAVQLKCMVDELSENEKDLVPVDESLTEVFKEW